jgi:hypothetical protein
MGLPSHFLEKKFVKDEKGDDITPFDGSLLIAVADGFSRYQKSPWESFVYKVNSV